MDFRAVLIQEYRRNKPQELLHEEGKLKIYSKNTIENSIEQKEEEKLVPTNNQQKQSDKNVDNIHEDIVKPNLNDLSPRVVPKNIRIKRKEEKNTDKIIPNKTIVKTVEKNLIECDLNELTPRLLHPPITLKRRKPSEDSIPSERLGPIHTIPLLRAHNIGRTRIRYNKTFLMVSNKNCYALATRSLSSHG